MLFRTNGQSETYEQALSDAGIPYLLRGGERFFDRPEVREARLLLRGAARSADSEDLPATVRAVLSGGGWSATPPEGGGAVRERWESLAALARLADDLTAVTPAATLRDFVAELDERADAQHAPTVDGVTLASLHAAKGLEWDAVFVVGVNEGMLPITYAETPEQVEEERRLLYVAVTRAREHLSVTWALARSPGGRGSRRPSRFLDGLHTLVVPAARGGPVPGPQGACGLPGLRQGADSSGRPQARAVRDLPVGLRRGAVRAVARVAGRAGARGQRPGVRRLHRRHADGAGRGAAHHGAAAAGHLGHRPDQAGALRRRRPGALRRRAGAVGRARR